MDLLILIYSYIASWKQTSEIIGVLTNRLRLDLCFKNLEGILEEYKYHPVFRNEMIERVTDAASSFRWPLTITGQSVRLWFVWALVYFRDEMMEVSSEGVAGGLERMTPLWLDHLGVRTAHEAFLKPGLGQLKPDIGIQLKQMSQDSDPYFQDNCFLQSSWM